MARRDWLQAVRQHHGIEHATLTVLSRRYPHVRLAARSDPKGFIVYGDVDTIDLKEATEEALARLTAGEEALAIHPNCGTNLVTAGVLSGVAALVAVSGEKRSLWDRVPAAILAATAALLVAPPLGRFAQEKVTTSPRVAGLRVVSVTQLGVGPIPRHRVVIAL